MADAKGRDNWMHTSAILACIANANRDPKKKPTPFKPGDFDPYLAKDRRDEALKVNDMAGLKNAFVKTKEGAAP